MNDRRATTRPEPGAEAAVTVTATVLRDAQSAPRLPQRIVCLTEETTETLYLLGEEARIVGISGFTVRPPQARREKPRVSAFTSARIDKIVALRPDFVFGFSDLQADIAAALIRRGVNVCVFNQRSMDEILAMITAVGALVGAPERTAALVRDLEGRVRTARAAAAKLPRRPRVYFEEWDSPQITGIRWVSELIEIAGGDDCFPELAREPMAKHRIVADCAGDAAARTRHHRGLLVRKKIPTRSGGAATRLGGGARGEKPPSVRDQIGGHTAAGPRRANRWS